MLDSSVSRIEHVVYLETTVDLTVNSASQATFPQSEGQTLATDCDITAPKTLFLYRQHSKGERTCLDRVAADVWSSACRSAAEGGPAERGSCDAGTTFGARCSTARWSAALWHRLNSGCCGRVRNSARLAAMHAIPEAVLVQYVGHGPLDQVQGQMPDEGPNPCNHCICPAKKLNS